MWPYLKVKYVPLLSLGADVKFDPPTPAGWINILVGLSTLCVS